MSGTQVAVYVFFGLLVAATVIYSIWVVQRNAGIMKELTRERDETKFLYDQLRKEKLEFDEKLQQAQSQERTYKAAYEDWKSKYSFLEERHLQLKNEFEKSDANPRYTVELEKSLSEKEQLVQALQVRLTEMEIKPSAHSVQSSSESKIISDLKSVLDQHLAIISQIIGDEKMEQYTQKSPKADPLHLIKGIDENISQKLQSHGVRTFQQMASTPRKDLRKWMIEFEDVDDKLIESWPFQAEAILNVMEREIQE